MRVCVCVCVCVCDCVWCVCVRACVHDSVCDVSLYIFHPQVEKTFKDITGDVYPVVVLGHKENDTVAKVCKSFVSLVRACVCTRTC